jgi:hypothetical protein
MAFAKRQEAPAMIVHFYFYIFPGFSDFPLLWDILLCIQFPFSKYPCLLLMAKHEHVRTDIFTHVQHVLNHQPYTPSPSLNSRRYLYGGS